MNNQIKTFVFLALLSGLVMLLGGALGGQNGVVVAFAFAMIMNFGSYWYSDKIVLALYKARELSPAEAPFIHATVVELAARAGVPTPRLCLIPEQAPNAFATGRNPENAVIAVTEGIVRLLSPEELRGVLAHEMAHIVNRDILLQSIAGVLASAITSIAYFMRFAAFFGGRSSDGERSNPAALLAMAILAPLAAMLLQMALSRSREFYADQTGARLSGQPLALAGALHKLAAMNQRIPMQSGSPATAEMFVVSPFFGASMQQLFSTHPNTEERIRRLQAMANQ